VNDNDKEWFLLHAEQCREFAGHCIDPSVAAKFIELARFYQSWAGDVEMELQRTDLLRPCRSRTDTGPSAKAGAR
jgi:hypothetical protein